MELNLGDVQETMLIPLSIKASETLRPNARIKDEKAVKIIEALGIKTKNYDKFMSHEGVVARTILFDKEVISYVHRYPDAVCINLGCGLDNRFSRVDNGKILWYDIDLPDSLGVRKNFFPDQKRVTMIAGSVLEPDWTNQVKKGRKTIIIAEGLLMYFKQEEIKKLLSVLSEHFPEFVLIAELSPPFVVKSNKRHDTIKNTKAVFQWGVETGEEVMKLCSGLRLIKEESFNTVMKRFTFRGWLFAAIPKIKNLNNRMAIFYLKRG